MGPQELHDTLDYYSSFKWQDDLAQKFFGPGEFKKSGEDGKWLLYETDTVSFLWTYLPDLYD